jgi:hypothetical protein
MKTTYVLAALLALSMVAFAFVAPVAAQEPIAFGPTLMTTRKGRILTWYFETSDTTHGSFSGLNIIPESIVATCWDSQGIVYTVTPYAYNIVLAENYVELYFYKQNLPKGAIGNKVTGSLTTGDTFLASGPGWAWSNVR